MPQALANRKLIKMNKASKEMEGRNRYTRERAGAGAGTKARAVALFLAQSIKVAPGSGKQNINKDDESK